MRSSPDPASTLWPFATGFYARPGVEPILLRLQDEHGVDILLLIALLYAGRRGIALADSDVQDLVAQSEAWRSKAILPLRAARRGLKSPAGARPDPEQEELRIQIKSAELAAERLLIRRLEALLPPEYPPVAARQAIAANLGAYLNTLPEPVEIPPALIEESLSL